MSDEATELIETMAAQRGGHEDPVWTWLARRDPGYMAAVNEYIRRGIGLGDAEDDGRVLPSKTRALVVIALTACLRDWHDFPQRLDVALDLGATDEEVLEILKTTAVLSGGPPLRMGIEQLVRARERRGETDATA